MASLRDNSQQDRRVYVGNLSYDVKWHHLKDFMRQGSSLTLASAVADGCSRRSSLCRCSASSKWNVKGGLISWLVLLAFFWMFGCLG